ncbi:LacI family DNA-binding transcriptional regulator [Cryobacterium sp. CG_9.6]|uniref:LacI family DNA-binding transcriptional regulator n=1 Tax=Cryobacterium sp. CG_9.6 TaxID=2760710 RepID=UPI002476D1E2|nr:LacI family DNA-binding transcriptional regulator [Cryobacterium sp. CG_9.6]MDH6237646.1 DNA-binding LacI/PurR family transcriptional regulator [Cryobacterium sp. CG_9.6]
MVTVPRRRKRATIHDVAAEAGVSRGTVSRVVNNERYVSAEARSAIEAAIEKVGYVPNTAARNLVMQRSQAVGLLVHEPHSLFLEDPNIGEILLGANTALSRADYQMVSLVIESDRDTERVARYLSGGFVDGIVVISAREQDPITRVIERLDLPAAFVGHPLDLVDLPYVSINNTLAARAITERLMKTGRRRIGMIVAALDRDSGIDRLAGFTAALGDRFDPALVASVPLYTYADGQAGMRMLLERDPLIDGVFAASDAIAAGALNALREAGRSVPGDVGIVGFDDSAWAVRCQPLLSTVRQPANKLGERAAESVLSQLRGEAPELGGILLETEIVWRDSA